METGTFSIPNDSLSEIISRKLGIIGRNNKNKEKKMIIP